MADEYQDRVEVFNREGHLLTYIGDIHSNLPGQFKALVGIAIDKQNRVFTTEQYPGRMQMFRYITDAEAAAEKARREAELEKTASARKQPSPDNAQKVTEAPVQKPEVAAPASKPSDPPAQKTPAPPPG